MSNVKGAEISYYMEYIRCQRPDCSKCTTSRGHGPYWFASLIYADGVRRMYLGKIFRNLAVDDFFQGHFSSRDKDEQKDEFQKSGTMNFGSLFSRKKSKLEEMISSQAQNKRPEQHKQIPPSRGEFERDILMMGQMPHRPALKARYRQLIKKYHPDKYPERKELNQWMAEINSQFQEQWKQSS